MLVLTADEIRTLAPMPCLIDVLAEAFRAKCSAPVRQVVKVPGGAGDRLFLSMPAFGSDGRIVVKVTTVFPDNATKGLANIQAAIVVFSGTGTPIAVLDGTAVTRLRTGAASALASRYLSREDSAHLAIVGTGALAPVMAVAHCSVRPIRRISVWGRRRERAEQTASCIQSLVAAGVEVKTAPSVEAAVTAADVVSCATSSSSPLVAGQWLRPGTLLDLVGSFSPTKREVDDDAVLRSRIFVDTFEGALTEAGDILNPLSRGIINRERVEGELADLVSGRVQGRISSEEIILFKSVGTAIEDFAAASLVVASVQRGAGSENDGKARLGDDRANHSSTR